MSNETYHLFVYGSLRSGFRNPVYKYLTQYFHLLGDAVVRARLYDAGTHPVAAASEDDHYINGELYAINKPEEFSWAIEQLDDYEGLNTEEGETPLYRREQVEVYQNGEPVTAWIYWYNKSIEGMPAIETGDVLKYLQEKNKP
jgi:gamma-glutamylcyclotransferase (GGCT)/AIG2-like uncharacterized protein YtfP